MSEEKKELKKNLKNEELCEGKEKLSIEELDKVNGGSKVDLPSILERERTIKSGASC